MACLFLCIALDMPDRICQDFQRDWSEFADGMTPRCMLADVPSSVAGTVVLPSATVAFPLLQTD